VTDQAETVMTGRELFPVDAFGAAVKFDGPRAVLLL
jgi:hypothetical protein